MPPIQEQPRALDFVFSEANGWRSRERVVIRTPLVAGTAIPLVPGTLLYPELNATDQPTGFYLPVTVLGLDPADEIPRVTCILGYWTDNRDGPVEATVIMRQAEVNSGYLIYALSTTAGTDFTQNQIDVANAALLNNGIIVRQGVLAESLVAPRPLP